MNTFTERMMKLRTASMPKNNIKIKSKLSTMAHAAIALMLLVGNSSFTSTIKSQNLNSNSAASPMTTDIGDEINAVKISRASQKMISKADREIHMNMVSLISALNAFRIPFLSAVQADNANRVQFYAEFALEFNDEITIWTDEQLSNRFNAENIQMDSNKYTATSDLHMFKSFYQEGYTVADPSLMTAGDTMISLDFLKENN